MALFDKFASRTPASQTPEEAVVADVIDNLNNVLNTRRHFGSFLQDFGISDLSECTSREEVAKAVMHEVRKNIDIYEPRVEVTQIVLVEEDNPLRLAFTIECRLRNSKRALEMVFDTVFAGVKISNPSVE